MRPYVLKPSLDNLTEYKPFPQGPYVGLIAGGGEKLDEGMGVYIMRGGKTKEKENQERKGDE